MKPLRVAIFGAGIAGLTLAAALRASGHDCRVYERRGMKDSGGMGFILSARALADLDEAGVVWPGRSPGTPLRRFRRYDPKGVVSSVDDMPAGWRGVRRTNLIEALRLLVPETTIEYGAGLATLPLDSRGRPKEAILTTGARVQADLYVAADGARSRARRTLFPWWPEREASVQELVGVVEDSRVAAWAGDAFHKFCARGIAAGVLPVGGDTVVWFAQFDRERFAAAAESAPSRATLARRLVGRWAFPIPRLLAATPPSQTHVWQPIDCDPPPRLHTANLALLGDAAHPLLPFTSQGVAAAVAGAKDLAAALNATDCLDVALQRYSGACRARCTPHVARGRRMSQQFRTRGAPAALPIAV